MMMVFVIFDAAQLGYVLTRRPSSRTHKLGVLQPWRHGYTDVIDSLYLRRSKSQLFGLPTNHS